MNVAIIPLMFGYLSISSSLPTDDPSKQNLADSVQTKRDISLSYAATDIGSKEGTRVKTITVIKNVAGIKNKPLKIDPKLHKSEDWGSNFRDNFEAYGVIPDVPDIDDLFEFVNKKEDKNPKEKDNPEPKKTDEEDKKSDEDDEEAISKEVPTSSSSTPVEEVQNESKEEKVEKISGDAEIIQPGGKQGKVKSQSLDLGKYSVHEDTFDVNFSSSEGQYSSNKKREKYIQSPSDSYYYSNPSRPSSNSPSAFPSDNGYSSQSPGRGSVTVTTPSGRKFDIPFGNATDNPPYIAPNFRRNPNLPPVQQIVSSSQRPYIAPKVRKNYEVQYNNTSKVSNNNSPCNATGARQEPAFNVYRNIPTNIRFERFGGYKPSLPRSRGLRY